MVFGDYIDIYDMTQAVDDGATVKIYYENRIIKLEVDSKELEKIDEEFEELSEGYEEYQKEKMKVKFSKMEAIVGSLNRLKELANDIVNHYETKSKTIKGKAMIVCMSRKICVNLYDEIVKLRPNWHSDDDDKGNTGIDSSQIIALMLEKLELLREIMHRYDYTEFITGSPREIMNAITGGMDFILGLSEESQKEFKLLCIELAKAHSLCAATDEGRKVAVEVSYFKAVKASLMELTQRGVHKKTKKEIEDRINQLLEKSIISEDVIDVFDALNLKQPDVSILSEEFLEEVKNIKYKNLAVEMLKKLLEGNIKVMEKRNVVKSEKFSQKLKKSLNKYRNQAITNAEVIEELIKMANELKKARAFEKDLGLSEDEIAFYDALTDDEIVREVMSDEVLKKIAQELSDTIRRQVNVDYNVRDNLQAGMRNTIKRLLKKYDYPPKRARHAIEIVMRQTELMSENIAYEKAINDRFKGIMVAEDNVEYKY